MQNRVTVKDIATAVGVSVATVSNVLNDRPNLGADSRRKVLEALTFRDAILRHRGDATDVTKRFDKLSQPDQDSSVECLRSL